MRWPIALAVLALPAAAAAQPAPRATLAVAGPEEEATRLVEAITGLLSDLQVSLESRRVEGVDPREVVTPQEEPDPPLARIWIALGAERSTVYLADGPWERVLVRHVPAESGIDEAVLEQVALIVQAAVEALLAGARIGFERAEAREVLGVEPEPGPEPPPEPDPEPRPEIEPEPEPEPGGEPIAAELGLGYALSFWARGPEVTHLLHLSAGLIIPRPRASPFVIASAALRIPQTAEEPGLVKLAFDGVDVRIEAGADLPLTDRTTLRLGGGLLLEVVNVEPRNVPGSPIALAPADTFVGPLVCLRAMLFHRFWREVRAGIGLILDFDTVDTRYVITYRDGDLTVTDPLPVRLAFVAALTARL